MYKSVPREAIQAWQRELASIPLSEDCLEDYTKQFAESYRLNNTKYINATIDELVEYTIAALSQILRFTAQPIHRAFFHDLWKRYELAYPRLRINLEKTRRG